VNPTNGWQDEEKKRGKSKMEPKQTKKNKRQTRGAQEPWKERLLLGVALSAELNELRWPRDDDDDADEDVDDDVDEPRGSGTARRLRRKW